MIQIFVFAMLIGSLIPLVLLRAWAIVCVWTWFAIPLGAPAIGIAWSIGLSVLVDLFNYTPPPKAEKGGDALKNMGKAYALIVTKPLLCVLIAWIAHQWMPA